MKKILLGLFIILTMFTITACKKDDNKNTSENNKQEEKEEINNNSSNSNNNKSVVLYFSATGTTKKIAERIADKSGSDIIEIIPKQEYTSADLNYNSDCRANKEQNDDKARPEIKNTIDINKYDTVYLGYPIWWGTNPRIILTLLDTYDFTNKTIIPFCTSGSTGIEGSVNDLRKYNSKLNIKDGMRFSSSSSDDDIISFINKYQVINNEVGTMKAIINNKEYIVNLESNETVNSLIKLLPMSITMNELNGNEKYIYLDNNLPTNSYIPKHINAGDVMLYGNNCLVIFYKSFDTSYSYTKIGHIDNLEDLGNGNIIVKLEK